MIKFLKNDNYGVDKTFVPFLSVARHILFYPKNLHDDDSKFFIEAIPSILKQTPCLQL